MGRGNLAILSVSTAVGLILGAVTSVADGFAGALGMATLLLSMTERCSGGDRLADSDPRGVEGGLAARDSEVESPNRDREEDK